MNYSILTMSGYNIRSSFRDACQNVPLKWFFFYLIVHCLFNNVYFCEYGEKTKQN